MVLFSLHKNRELPPPNTTRVFTHEELAEHDGKDPEAPIYVAIKGTVFDVSAKRAMYGPGAGYSCFAGKDASKVKKLEEKNGGGGRDYRLTSLGMLIN